jgi:hypothetical protein
MMQADTLATTDSGRPLRVALDDLIVELDAPQAVVDYVRERFPVSEKPERTADVVSRLRLLSHPRPVAGVGTRRITFNGDVSWCRGVPGMPELTIGVRASDPPQIVLDFARSPLRRLYKRVVVGVRPHDLLESLVSYAVLYPGLLASERRGRHPLHASAVVKDGRAIVLLGLPGAGKSTVAAALRASGFALLSDNLVTVGPEGIWPVPEPVKLDARSRELAGAHDSAGLAATYGRSAERLDVPSGPFQVAALVNLLAGDATVLAEVDDMTPERLRDLNQLALELHAYYHYRSFVRLALGAARPGELDVFAGLLSATPTFSLSVGRDDVGAVCDILRGLVS